MASEVLVKLEERVANGMKWLTDHDQHGRFHLWFTARILPGATAPAQTPEDMEAYRVYYRARQQWERLWSEMVRLERVEGETASAPL